MLCVAPRKAAVAGEPAGPAWYSEWRMPIKIDLIQELQVALTAPAVAQVLRDHIKQALLEVLTERDTDTWLDHHGAARVLGLRVPAFVAKCRRYADLDQMSAGSGRMRRWRRADLEAWLREQGRIRRRTPLVPGSSSSR